MPSNGSFHIEHASRSDVGMRRSVNQDSLAVANGRPGPLGGEHFYMVADGMGAHAAGELASQIATDTVPLSYFKSKQSSAPAALRQAVREANTRINEKGSSEAEFHGMGTTCSCLVLSPAGALVAHVGDSRVYRLRDGVLEQLTFDHSLVWEMAEAINASESDVPAYIPKNVITRSLGPHEKVKVDLEGPHEVLPGDHYLLCSDGLSGVVSDALLGAVLESMDIKQAAQTLVDLANLFGGPDNISVVLAHVVDCPSDERAGAAPAASAPSGIAVGGIIGAVVCLAAFAWFMSIDNHLGMLLSAAGCGAAIVYSMLNHAAAEATGFVREIGGPYGNGPYRQRDCREPREAAETLHKLVEDLSAVSEIDHDAVTIDPHETVGEQTKPYFGPTLKIDWGSYTKRKQQAEDSFARQQYEKTVRSYCDLISEVMNEARGGEG